jgi:hypothetical protein
MVLWVALYGAVVGACVSIVLMARHGRLSFNLQQVVALRVLPTASRLKAPYGLAIAGGVYLAALAGPIG